MQVDGRVPPEVALEREEWQETLVAIQRRRMYFEALIGEHRDLPELETLRRVERAITAHLAFLLQPA